MAKKLFDITVASKIADPQNSLLLMEMGRHNFLYIITDEKNEFTKLSYHQLDGVCEQDLLSEMEEIIAEDESLRFSYKETMVLYNFPESQLVPDTYFNVAINGPFSEIIQGDFIKGIRLSEKIKGYNLHNVFTVPASLYQLFKENYKSNKYWHYYSWWLQCSYNQLVPEREAMQVIFYPHLILVAVVKDHELHLVQQFTYQTAEDVAYHLLNICSIFQLSPETTHIRLCGMIDTSSSVYNEIQKYFGNASPDFYSAVSPTPELQEYPSHFFSPILKLAACAS